MRGLPTLLAVAALFLSGSACTSDGESSDVSAADTLGAFMSGSDVPADKREAVLAALDAIAPGLATEPDDSLINARATCENIQVGASDLIEAAKFRFIGDGVESLTDDQAEQIIAFISTQPWCPK
jgi:hypothetical protein